MRWSESPQIEQDNRILLKLKGVDLRDVDKDTTTAYYSIYLETWDKGNQMRGTSTGLAKNIAGLLCYVLGWITGLVFLLIEHKNEFVRLHALQSIIIFVPLTGAFVSLNYIGEIALEIFTFLIVFTPIVWIVSMVKAYQGKGIWLKRTVGKTSTRSAANVAGMLCYIFGWISGLMFLLMKKQDKFIRFHAMQSVIVFGALTIVESIVIVTGLYIAGSVQINVITLPSFLIFALGFLLWVLLMVKAYQGTTYKLPWAGNLAEKWAA